MHRTLAVRSVFIFFLLCFSFLYENVNATHIRAGDIIARSDTTLPVQNRNPLRYFFTLIIYTDQSSGADDPNNTIFFGDGSSQSRPRAQRVDVGNGTNRNVYYYEHTYGSPGVFRISYTGANRNTGIRNISNSDQQTFYIETIITIDPLLTANTSPVLLVPPIDVACSGQVFVHNPGAFDPDGDSLSFKLRVPKRQDNTQNPAVGDVPGYRFPDDPSFGAGVTFTLNPFTGQITWSAPRILGEYNIAFVVEEWRGRRKLGEVVRDMQIIVRDCNNRAPVLSPPRDICIVANQLLRDTVRATDPNNDPLILSAFGGVLPPATFSQAGQNRGIFTWRPGCNDVRRQPYQVVFKAEDQPGPPGPRLADLQTWNITVVGPAPQGLTATASGRDIQLTWNRYTCQNADSIHIYRRAGRSNFIPDSCETGVPAGTGYQKIATVPVGQTTYTDRNLARGPEYCYIIYASFPEPAGGESLASAEACSDLRLEAPVLTKVSVAETDATQGRIDVCWTQPREGLNLLTPPFAYRLLRAEENGTGNQNFTEVFTTQNLADTCFTDQGLNTLDQAYTYMVEFYHSGIVGNPTILLEASAPATSVRLEAESAGGVLDLAWNYDAPWNNSGQWHYIFREINGAFTLIDSVQGGTTGAAYTDRGTFGGIPLRQGQRYCYFVTTQGSYGSNRIVSPLRNNSQEFCVVLRDTTAPCPPVLAIDVTDCDRFDPAINLPPYENVLTWTPDRSAECGQDIRYYTIYFSQQQGGALDSIATTTDTTFIHRNLPSFAGCYVVTATDSSGNESVFSNQVCKENCFFFRLPNIITPNGDNLNDVFRPDRRALFIRSITFKVFNRWGMKVYESSDDPMINWGGVNEDGKELAAGVYYYTADVEFISINPEQSRQTVKGWVEIVR